MRNVGLSALAMVLVLALGGCSGDDDESPEGESSSTPAATPTQQAKYAVELTLADEPAPSSGAPSASPAPGAPVELMVTVTNTGKREDSYLMQLLPPEAGGVVPPAVTLAPGQQEVVRVVLNSGTPEREITGELVALSRAQGELLGTLELPD